MRYDRGSSVILFIAAFPDEGVSMPFRRLPVRSALLPVLGLAGMLLIGAAVSRGDATGDEGKESSSTAATKQALAEFNGLIGGWRGVGLPRRGSTAGAWSEKAEWIWKFDEGQPAIEYRISDGKQLQSARLTWDPQEKVYRLAGQFGDETERVFEGKLTGRKLVLDSSPDDDGTAYRITITRLNPKRTLVLYERRQVPQTFYFRIAEVGYTRAGTRLAREGADEPECVVTGGAGTIKVMHKGQTYYVCCTGCKQAFDDDPEGILAEYRQKVAERRKAEAAGN